MSGLQLKIQPSFPAQVVGVSPIVVTKSGLTYSISLNQLPTNSILVTQIKSELVVLGLFDVAAAAIPGDPKSAVNQAWSSGGMTQQTGPLLTAVFTAIGYNTPALQNAFIAAALLLPY